MTEMPKPVRLFYSLVACDPPRGSRDGQSLRILVTYASGKQKVLRADFQTPAEAENYIAVFYPDLIGKCSEIAELRR